MELIDSLNNPERTIDPSQIIAQKIYANIVMYKRIHKNDDILTPN